MAKTYSTTPAFPPDVSRDDFGHWLSGFTDGEGCFKLTWHNVRGKTKVFHTPGANFEIGLRSDDLHVLEQVRAFWGVGNLRIQVRSDGHWPMARYIVAASGELSGVVAPHFDRFPLRAKKGRDFLIWKAGVELLHRVNSRPRVGRSDGLKGMYPKWSDEEKAEFGRLFDALKAVRVYAPAA